MESYASRKCLARLQVSLKYLFKIFFRTFRAYSELHGIFLNFYTTEISLFSENLQKFS